MNFKFTKISKEFHHYKQAEFNELLETFLIDTCNSNRCNIFELTERWGFKTMKYVISRFKREVEQVWREELRENKGK